MAARMPNIHRPHIRPRRRTAYRARRGRVAPVIMSARPISINGDASVVIIAHTRGDTADALDEPTA